MPDLNQVTAFFLVFLRAAAFMMAGPLYAVKGIPPLVKVGFSLVLAVVVFPVVEPGTALPEDGWGFVRAVLCEIGTGLLLGLAVTMLISAFRIAGQFIDLQIGYAMASLIDPASGAASSLLAQYLYLLALLFFLLLDGHYTLIMALYKSYQLVPPGMADIGAGSVAYVLLKIFSGAFTTALQVSAPVLAVLLVTDLALGFLTRTTPQINVFLTGFPVKIAVGLLTLSFLIPLLGTVFHSIFNMIENDLYLLMRELV